MEEALAGVTAEIQRKFKEWQQQETLVSVLTGFVHAIDWREPWLIAVMAFHVTIMATALLTRKYERVQLGLFCLAMAIVFNAEYLNRLGRDHWQSFAGQQYFDESGVFMSAVVSGPLLLAMFILLLNYLRSCFFLMVSSKRKELAHKARLRKKQEGGGNSSAPAPSRTSEGQAAPASSKKAE